MFRQHLIVKGENRDTAWFAMLDTEWDTKIRRAYALWLDVSNFDENGFQIKSLSSFF